MHQARPYGTGSRNQRKNDLIQFVLEEGLRICNRQAASSSNQQAAKRQAQMRCSSSSSSDQAAAAGTEEEKSGVEPRGGGLILIYQVIALRSWAPTLLRTYFDRLVVQCAACLA